MHHLNTNQSFSRSSQKYLHSTTIQSCSKTWGISHKMDHNVCTSDGGRTPSPPRTPNELSGQRHQQRRVIELQQKHRGVDTPTDFYKSVVTAGLLIAFRERRELCRHQRLFDRVIQSMWEQLVGRWGRPLWDWHSAKMLEVRLYRCQSWLVRRLVGQLFQYLVQKTSFHEIWWRYDESTIIKTFLFL